MSLTRFAIACAAIALIVVPACRESVATGENGKKLAITKPVDQTIKAGDTNDIRIAIDRTNFVGNIEVDFDDLPSGIDLKDGSPEIPAGEDSKVYTLVADRDAKPVKDHRVKVTVQGGGLEISEFFMLTVEAAQ